MDTTFSFKIYLVNEDFKVLEVRKFISTADAITNFVYLREKIQTIFSGLRGKNFSIVWKDAEEDLITISCDEELIIALKESNDQNHAKFVEYGLPSVHKLHVILHTEKKDEKTKDKNQGVLHINVICDGCDTEIRGFRYKCVVCEDYDLCSLCEAHHLHDEHFMIRIPQPLQWSSHSKNQLIRDFKKFVIKIKKDKEDAYNKARSRRHHSGYPNECPFPLSSFWAAFPGQCPMKKSTEMPRETQSNDAGASNATSNQEDKKDTKPLPNPFNIPIDIPRILEAFGLDIGIEVQPENKPSTSQTEEAPKTASQGTSPMAESATKKFPGEGKKLIDKNKNKSDESDDKVSVSDTASTSSREEDSDIKAAREADWTVIDKPQAAHISRASSAATINEQLSALNVNDNVAPEKTPEVTSTAPSAPEAATTQKIYPQLKKDSEVIQHPDPKVRKALETLVSMGFSNEGGLLAYLLQKEDCNINKVLDLLQGARL